MIETINTNKGRFNMKTFINRRFMYNPSTGTIVLGEDDKFDGSHAVEFYDSGCNENYDDFIRGWIGNGKEYPCGIIHFAPNIPKECAELYDKAFLTLEMFKENGMQKKTVIRGFGAIWERSAKDLLKL